MKVKVKQGKIEEAYNKAFQLAEKGKTVSVFSGKKKLGTYSPSSIKKNKFLF